MDRPLIRIGRLIAPIILVLCLLWLWSPAVVLAADPAPMAPAALSVPEELEDAAAQALGDYPPSGVTVTHYAITNYSNPAGDYYMLSVAGLDTDTPDDWNLLDHLSWWGNVIVYSDALTITAASQYAPGYQTMIDSAYGDDGDLLTLNYAVDESIYFPWQPGTAAYYGYLGVHDGVYGLSGDVAVDWFGGASYSTMPNMVYASQSGTVTRVCNDGVSVGVVIGNFGYLHLQPWVSFTEGQTIQRGQQLGPMVLGSFDDNCGYAQQQPGNYHVHWAFIPSGGYFTTENWTLNISDDCWRSGDDKVCPEKFMTAYWNGNALPILPTVTPGGPTLTPTPQGTPGAPNPEYGGVSFWDPIVYGVFNIIASVLQSTPDHNEIGLATTYLSAAATVFRVTFVLMNSNFNLTVPFFAVGVMLILEGMRIITAVARRIFEFIGYVLKFIPFVG